MSPSLYGFVKGREPVSPEEVVQEFLSLPHLNGRAHAHVEELVADDPRFLWEEGALCTTDVTSLPLDQAPYVVFDVETTGSSAKEGAITEIGALKVVRGRVDGEFATLVNPGRRIEPFVVRLTGITDRMVADAPTAEVFLKLVELSEAAGLRTVGETATLGSRTRRIEPQKGHLAEHLPRTPGVYYFVDKHGTVLYVGKAKDLKSRVKTYFNGGDGRRKVGRLVREVAEVRYEETSSELHALVFEAREIKRLLPRYNSAGRGEKASWFIRLDLNEPYPVPERVSGNGAEGDVTYLGPYRSAGVLDACIEALGRIFPLRRCGGVREDGVCFYGQMGRCAPCLGMGEREYRTKVIGGLTALLRGEGGEEYLEALIGERKRLADELEFEAAARLRDLISGIERVRLARAVVHAEGVQAVVVPSTEPGIVEVFTLFGGRLVAHKGFEPEDEAGLTLFAKEVLGGHDNATAPPVRKGVEEAQVVGAYLRRRGTDAKAVHLSSALDLVDAVKTVAERLTTGLGETGGTLEA